MKKIIEYIRKISSAVMFQAFVQVNDFKPLSPGVEQSSKLSGLYASQDLATYVNRLFVFALTIGAIMAVVRIMWAGYKYMGQGDMWSKKGEAKEIFSDVIFGLLLLLSIYLILFQINPNLLSLKALDQIKNAGVQIPSTQQTTAATPEAAFPGQVPDSISGQQTINNGCSTLDCQSASGLGPTPGIPF